MSGKVKNLLEEFKAQSDYYEYVSSVGQPVHRTFGSVEWVNHILRIYDLADETSVEYINASYVNWTHYEFRISYIEGDCLLVIN